MKLPATNDYVVSGTTLLAAAAVLLLVATATDRRDLTSATLFLCGVATFLSGVFMLSFSRPEPFDAETASLLSVSSMLNQCRICADLGVRGDAWFVPSPGSEGQVREFVPVAGSNAPAVLPDFSFVADPESPGVVLVPAAAPLLEHCEKRFSLLVPSAEEELVPAIRELVLDVLELADEFEIVRSGDSLVMTRGGTGSSPGACWSQGSPPSAAACTPAASAASSPACSPGGRTPPGRSRMSPSWRRRSRSPRYSGAPFTRTHRCRSR